MQGTTTVPLELLWSYLQQAAEPASLAVLFAAGGGIVYTVGAAVVRLMCCPPGDGKNTAIEVRCESVEVFEQQGKQERINSWFTKND